MRFAQFLGSRIEAVPGAEGTCPCCGASLRARCGAINVWHWAHKGRRNCDPWWEPETEWHRAWKSEFPDDWVEVLEVSDDGERHIADVKTPYGVVIEFQHSGIQDTERKARERFYGDMIWVVDGKRLKRDHATFLDGMGLNKRKVDGIEHYVFSGAARQITKRWASSKKLVVLDFGEDEMWCISPHKVNWQFFAKTISKREFVDAYSVGRIPHVAHFLMSPKA